MDLQSDGGFLAGFFIAIRSIEAIVSKFFFRNKAGKTIDDMASLAEQNHQKMVSVMEAHKMKIIDLMEDQKATMADLKNHAVMEERLFARLESVLEQVADNSRELSMIMKNFVSDQKDRR